jgi:hypothetical protein
MCRTLRALSICAMSAASALATAAPPANSPYITDPQNLNVQDETAQGIGSLNMVLCVVGAMDPADLVNAGPYVALVDMTRCQDAKGGSTAAAAGATNFASAVVEVTRTANSDPMIAKVWLSVPDQGSTTKVYAFVSATQSPAAAPPYGAFRMDYIGEAGGNVRFDGYIDSNTPGVIKFLETGQGSSNTALAMSANATTSGSGTMLVGANGGGNPVNFNFAYNPSYFHRNDGSNDECFDRARADATLAVFQYGTYNANDGTRVDQAHPGFAVLATDAGTPYYGFANYWGINFQGLDIPDGTPVSAIHVIDQRPGNTTPYALSKVGGKLTRWAQVSTTLGALDGIPITSGADLTGLTSGNAAVTGANNWVIQWNSSGGAFTVVGRQSCDSNGCVTSAVNPVATVNASAFNTIPISGYANSYGGNLNIPPTGSPHTAADAVFYYNQSTLIPGGAIALTLYCLSQCPTGAQLTGYSGATLTTPFANGTDTQWFSAPSIANSVPYTFGAGGLMDGAGAAVTLEQASQYPPGSPYAQNGIQTGWLLAAPLTNADCPAGMPAGSICQPANPPIYYTWQTGPNQWNQSLWLTTGGSVVAFDPPQNIAYTVPQGSAYGSYAGLPILLQFNGFGNLQGIPGECVNPTDNSAEDCSISGASYVPMFSLPDGTTMMLPSLSGASSTPVIVKALNGAILLKSLGSGAAECSTMTLTPLPLPAGGLHDPSNPSDSEYLGTMPTVSAAPRVIDGVLQ